MKYLYLIVKKDLHRRTLELLSASAQTRGIMVRPLITEEFDFSHPPKLTRQDGLYRISPGYASSVIEKYLIRPDVATFYDHPRDGIGKLDNVVESSLIHRNEKLPIIPTIFSITRDKDLLQKYAECLGGFPIIVKALGGEHGIGVIKVDSFDSLASLADYLAYQPEHFILRKYIDCRHHARLIVLGDRVIDSIEYQKPENDFRTNAGLAPVVAPRSFGVTVNALAVRAVRTLGYQFGGVDILIDRQKKPYIAEVNFPCFFPRAQDITGVDISGLMIDFLNHKSRS